MKSKVETDAVDFRRWLEKVQRMGHLSAGDVVSRVRRVNVLIDFNFKASDDELLRRLEESDKFKRLGYTVRFQLRRAVRLYKQWQKDR
jgi:DNA mismatch endonuclease, patch repair protein